LQSHVSVDLNAVTSNHEQKNSKTKKTILFLCICVMGSRKKWENIFFVITRISHLVNVLKLTMYNFFWKKTFTKQSLVCRRCFFIIFRCPVTSYWRITHKSFPNVIFGGQRNEMIYMSKRLLLIFLLSTRFRKSFN